MSIYRKPRPTDNFYLLDKSISEDSRLSWAARGLLIYLLGKPDHWRVSTAHLVKQTQGAAKHSKRDAVRALLSELIDAGYVTREPVRDESGAFKGTDYAVSEAPSAPEADSPETDNPGPVKPTPVNPPLASIEGVARTDNSARTDNPPNPPSPGGDLLGEGDGEDAPTDPDVDLPDNIDPNTWLDFLEHRKQIKAKMTARAKTLTINKLARFAAAGHDPNEILQESIMNGWKGVFEPKGGGSGGRAPNHHTGINDLDHSQGLRKTRDGRTTL